MRWMPKSKQSKSWSSCALLLPKRSVILLPSRAHDSAQAEDKDTKLAQAKECVNDVKDVVEILAKQLHDNQMVPKHCFVLCFHFSGVMTIMVVKLSTCCIGRSWSQRKHCGPRSLHLCVVCIEDD